MSIQVKLFLTLLTVGLIIVVSMHSFLRWSVDRGMLEYVNERALARQDGLVERLQSAYREDGGGDWAFLRGDRYRWQTLLRGDETTGRPLLPRERPGLRDDRFRPPPPAGHEPRRQGRPPPPGERGRPVLIDADHQPVMGFANKGRAFNERVLTLDGEEIGRLLVPRHDQITSEFDLRFVQQLQTVLLIGSGFIVLLTALAAFLLSAHFVKPVRQLAKATAELTRGRYATQADESRHDELGQLSRDFNELSRTLQANEQARNRWLADMSHELRTPMAVMRAELEAVQDGVRGLDEKTITSLQEELNRLQKLVADLQELSNADIGALRYQKSNLDLPGLLDEVTDRHRPMLEKAGLSLSVDNTCSDCECFADPDRITQLMDNLINNSAKYTDAGGQVAITLSRQQDWLQLVIEDSAPGVPEDMMPQLFDHLFRVESSRNRNTGGSGLGLAICERIVDAHGGELSASLSGLGGLRVQIKLPRSQVIHV